MFVGDFGADRGSQSDSVSRHATDEDQHVEIQTKGVEQAVITILLRDNIGVAYDSTLPPLGNTSQGLRIISQTWSAAHDTLTLDVAGKAGCDYELGIFDNGKSFQMLVTGVGGDLALPRRPKSRISHRFRTDKLSRSRIEDVRNFSDRRK